MDLSDRGGADRADRSREERGCRAALPSALLDRWLISSNGAGGRRVLEKRIRSAAACLADEIGPGRQRLAELDRSRADRCWKRVGIGRRLRDTRAEPRQLDETANAAAACSGSTLDPAERAVPRQHAAPFQQPPEMGDRGWSNIPAASGSRRGRRESARGRRGRSRPPRSYACEAGVGESDRSIRSR